MRLSRQFVRYKLVSFYPIYIILKIKRKYVKNVWMVPSKQTLDKKLEFLKILPPLASVTMKMAWAGGQTQSPRVEIDPRSIKMKWDPSSAAAWIREGRVRWVGVGVQNRCADQSESLTPKLAPVPFSSLKAVHMLTVLCVALTPLLEGVVGQWCSEQYSQIFLFSDF